MALILCPECGTEVSDKAEKCPKCSYPINKPQNPTQISPPEIVAKSQEGCFLQTLNVGCIIVATILVLIVAAVMTWAYFATK